MQLIQETCLTKAQRITLQNDAKGVKKQFQGGPTDPEQAKAAAGVGAMCVENLKHVLSAEPHHGLSRCGGHGKM